MNALQELCGKSALLPDSQLSSQHPQNDSPFRGMTHFDWNFHSPQLSQVFRKPPQREGATQVSLSLTRDLFRESNQHFLQEVERLKTQYVFRNNESVVSFLSSHRAAGSVLADAFPHLTEFFGSDTVFSLEVSSEEDEPQILYAIVMWRDSVEGAVVALESFDEKWWLDSSSQPPDITFTYELA